MIGKRKRIVFSLFVIVTVLASSFTIFFFFYLMGSGGEGSLEYANKFKQTISDIHTPESGEGIDPEYGFVRLENGDWILGISRDSHGWKSLRRGGGTIVLKDSHGHYRYFFGHCCGAKYHEILLKDRHFDTIEKCFQRLIDDGFVEIPIP